jgi:recombination protein RecT
MSNQAIQRTPATSTRLTLRDFVQGPAVKQRLLDVSSKYLQPEEIVRCVLLAASRNPRLAECTQDSILKCMMEAAHMGIRPGGINGRGWLIPRENRKVQPHVMECTFDPGWRGLADIARRSKLVKRIEARIVHKMDEFREVEGTEPSVRHTPYDGEEDPGPVVASYAIAYFPDGDLQFEVVRRRDLDKIRAVSASKTGPWEDWPEEMCRKSAVRRLCKYLPVDEELEYALEVATRAEVDADGVVPELPDPTGETQAKRIASKIKAKGEAPKAEPAESTTPGPHMHGGEPTDGPPPDDDREPGED